MGNAESSTLRHDRRDDRRTPHSRGGDDSTIFSYGRDSTTIGPNASHVTSKTDLTLTRDGKREDDSTFFSYGRAESSIFPIESQWTHKTDFTLTRDTCADPAVNSSNNTHTTASTSSRSIADQSIAMMNKLVSGGAALCGSLNQVNDDDDDDGDATNQQGMFARAERFVNCNKNFAKSSPMEEDYDARARQRRDGNFLGPEEDSDDEVDEDDDYSARIRAHNQSNSLNESSAATTVGRLFARAMASEIVSKPQGMKMDNETSSTKKAKGRDTDEDERMSEAAGDGVGVDADRALRAIKKFAMNSGGAGGADAPSDDTSKGPSPVNGDSGIAGSSIGGGITQQRAGPHTITIGLSLSRKHSVVGHPDTVTRQTAFDFNELQDRNYKYVSSTDPSGWLAGGGESPNGPMPDVTQSIDAGGDDDAPTNFVENMNSLGKTADDIPKKIAAPDTVHIPILHIDCPSEKAVKQVIKLLANGELIIPHMSVLPESLSASGDSPPDLVVRFGCERNDDLPSDE